MFLRPIDLTTALRPSLLPDESLLYVQNSVGLYNGKLKLQEHQNGQAYLTSHRICYIDETDPRGRAAGLFLKDVDRIEFYACYRAERVPHTIADMRMQAGFLKSSPKITLYPKGASRLQGASLKPGLEGSDRSPSATNSPSSHPPPRTFDSANASNGSWVCPICSFSNPVPTNFDPALANSGTTIPPCLACGIRPPLNLIVKAAISAISSRPIRQPSRVNGLGAPGGGHNDQDEAICPRCTFHNHPSLRTCEMCGATLAVGSSPFLHNGSGDSSRADSPAPGSISSTSISGEFAEGMKISFRAGGEKTFHERLRGALTQKKWLTQNPPSASAETFSNSAARNAVNSPRRTVGIAGLEHRGQQLREQNQVVIGNAFEDLEALMASAKQIISLAEQFASQSKGTETAEEGTDAATLLSQLNLTTTKDMLNSNKGGDLYIAELCRSLAEFLTDDTKGILKHEGGVVSLVDLWAVYNRARGGVELVSPTDLACAVELFEKLKMPLRLRRFKSGLLVVQERSRTDEKTISAFLSWMRQMKEIPPERPVNWDWQLWGRGVTAQEAAERFGWSVGIATEELEMAEDQGALCREVAMEGVRFWENAFTHMSM